MKKVYFIIIIILTIPFNLFALSYSAGNTELNIYGRIFGDIFYTYGSNSMLNNFYGTGKNIQAVTSNASKGSSRIGINIQHKNVEINFEAGITDPVRKFYLKYHFDKKKAIIC